MVYPLMAPSTIDRATTGQIVTLLGNQIAEGGAIRVLPADLDTQRADYLSASRKAGAQFYVTGFLTPLGDGASIVEQVVSTQSGIIVWSNSGQISTVADAKGQGDLLRAAILTQLRNGYAAFSAPAESTASSAPHNASTAVAPQANVGGLFHHHRAPAAAPAPAAASPAPSPTPER